MDVLIHIRTVHIHSRLLLRKIVCFSSNYETPYAGLFLVITFSWQPRLWHLHCPLSRRRGVITPKHQNYDARIQALSSLSLGVPYLTRRAINGSLWRQPQGDGTQTETKPYNLDVQYSTTVPHLQFFCTCAVAMEKWVLDVQMFKALCTDNLAPNKAIGLDPSKSWLDGDFFHFFG